MKALLVGTSLILAANAFGGALDLVKVTGFAGGSPSRPDDVIQAAKDDAVLEAKKAFECDRYPCTNLHQISEWVILREPISEYTGQMRAGAYATFSNQPDFVTVSFQETGDGRDAYFDPVKAVDDAEKTAADRAQFDCGKRSALLQGDYRIEFSGYFESKIATATGKFVCQPGPIPRT